MKKPSQQQQQIQQSKQQQENIHPQPQNFQKNLQIHLFFCKLLYQGFLTKLNENDQIKDEHPTFFDVSQNFQKDLSNHQKKPCSKQKLHLKNFKQKKKIKKLEIQLNHQIKEIKKLEIHLRNESHFQKISYEKEIKKQSEDLLNLRESLFYCDHCKKEIDLILAPHNCDNHYFCIDCISEKFKDKNGSCNDCPKFKCSYHVIDCLLQDCSNQKIKQNEIKFIYQKNN